MEMSTTSGGFCSKCGILRVDDKAGVPLTDCVCTAKARHKPDCPYIQAVRCPIDIGLYCKDHGRFPCESCICTCGEAPTVQEPVKG